MSMSIQIAMSMFMSMPMPSKIVSPRADNRPGGMREAIRIILPKTIRAQGPHKAAQGCLVRNPVAGGATAAQGGDVASPNMTPN